MYNAVIGVNRRKEDQSVVSQDKRRSFETIGCRTGSREEGHVFFTQTDIGRKSGYIYAHHYR